MRRRALAAALWLIAGGAVPAAAQSPAAALRPWRPVLTVGGAWLGTEDLGAVRAELRQSSPGTTSPPPFALFDTRSELGGSAAVEFGVAVPVTAQWAVEVRGSRRRPTITTTISGDVEAAGTFTATEPVAEYVVDAAVLYHPGWAAIGSRGRGFFTAGGGYLRQLHDDDVLVVTGATGHAGGGVRWWLVGGHGGREAGLTGEARWVFRRDGVTFRDGLRSLPALSVRAFVGF